MTDIEFLDLSIKVRDAIASDNDKDAFVNELFLRKKLTEETCMRYQKGPKDISEDIIKMGLLMSGIFALGIILAEIKLTK